MNKKKGKKAEKDRKNNHVSTSKSDASLDHFLDHNINNITNNIIPINALAREKRDFQGDDDLKKNNQGLDHFDNADINPDSLTGNQNQDQKGPAARELENSQKNPEQLDHFENPQNTGQLDHFENPQNSDRLDHFEHPQNSDRLDHFGNPKNSDRLDHFDDGLIKAKEAGLFQLLRSSQKFREDCAAMFGIEPNEVAARIDSFEVECRARGHQHQFLKDLRSHFVNWLRIALRCEKQVKEKYDKNQTRNIKSYDNGNDIRQSNATSQFENRRGSDVGLHTEADFLPPF
ncbi:MAG: hypothetical protein K2M31_07760 [Muribaculaceae bacterium]|nr:hypothetical protein [Muribaculaceae bacterium]